MLNVQPKNNVNIYLLASILLAYLFGVFVPLMDADAAHHANIALHMYLNDDYVNLVDKGHDYLDKPHLLFWLAALSYKLLGVHAFSYKLASLLFSLAGAFATYRLGTILYNQSTGKLAALILISAQAFMLACMDVKMDALLTANIILATWQLVETVTNKKWYNKVLAAFFLAMGFATKGQIGLVMPCVALFFFLLYRRDVQQIFSLKWVEVILMVVLFISPVLYAYYLQYDMHPEKTIRGMTGISGVGFILWGQNIERLDGNNWGGGKRDYFFYLHTMLWAFLPWSLMAYYAVAVKLKTFFKSRFRYIAGEEMLTTGTILAVFILISMSRFQLPHYINILFPFFSIVTASVFLQLLQSNRLKTLRVFRNMQLVMMVLAVPLVFVLVLFAFPVQSYLSLMLAFIIIGAGVFYYRKSNVLQQLIITSVAGIAVANILLNANFYPALMQYQAGYTLAEKVRERSIPDSEIAFYNHHSFVFDFDSQYLHERLQTENLPVVGNKKWIVTDATGLDTLRMKGLSVVTVDSADEFRITRLNMSFINPATRPDVIKPLYLTKIQ